MSPGAVSQLSGKSIVPPWSGDDGDNDIHQVAEHHNNGRDLDDGPQMPGAYPPAWGRGRVGVYPQPGPLHPRLVNPFGPAPVEPIAPRVTRGAPVVRPPRGIRGVRIGYAARGAYVGRGIGRTLVEGRESHLPGDGTDPGAGPAGVGATPADDETTEHDEELTEEHETFHLYPRGIRGL